MGALDTAILALGSVQNLWKFDDASGATVVDYGPGEDDAVLTGGYTRAQASLLPDDSGYSTLLDGSTGYAICGNINNFEYDDPFTLSAVVHLPSGSGGSYRTIMGKMTTGATKRGYQLFVTGDETLKLYLTSDDTGPYALIVETSAGYNFRIPRLVTVTYDGSHLASGVTIYVDGVAQKSLTTVADTLGTNSLIHADELYIGARTNANGVIELFLNGYIQSAAVFTDELTSAEVWELGSAWHSDFMGGILQHADAEAAWEMNETDGTIATDAFGRYPGTYTGTYTLNQEGLKAALTTPSVEFDGSTAYIDFGDVLDKDYNTAFSVMGVVRLDTALPAESAILFGKLYATPGPGVGYVAWITTDGRLAFKITNTSSTFEDTIYTDNAYDWSVARVITIVDGYTSGSHSVYETIIYIDGEAVDATPTSDTLTTQSTVNGVPLSLGARVAEPPLYPLDGHMQCFAFFSDALSAAEVEALHAPISAQFVTLTVGALCSDEPTSAFAVLQSIADTFLASDSLAGAASIVMNEIIEFADAVTFSRDLVAMATETLEFIDQLIHAPRGSLADGFAVADIESIGVGLALSAGIRSSDVLTARLASALTAGVVLADMLIRAHLESLADQAVLSDLEETDVSLTLVDLAELSDLISVLRDVALTSTDAVEVQDTVASARGTYANLLDSVLAGGVLRLPSGDYNVWVVNTASFGITQYEDYSFNSIAGNLGAKSDGLYLLEGDDDDGTDIAAYFESGLVDFGTARRKQVPDAYMGVTGDGRLLLKVTTSEDGSRVEDWYEADPENTSVQNDRFKIGRGLKSRFWKFRLENVDGADFDLTDMEVRAVVLNRRL